MSPLSEPPSAPEALAAFPRLLLEAGTTIARLHRRQHSPRWFNGDGHQRFDLPPPHGTLYGAAEPLGAMVEVFRDISLLDAVDVEARRLSTLASRSGLALADCTSRGARRFGITGAVHSTPAYDQTQRWAAAFRRAGFEGIRYLVSHDPAQQLVGYAIFGIAGEATTAGADLQVVETLEIPRDLLDELTTQLGITALPRLLEEP